MLYESPEATQRQRADIYYILFQFISKNVLSILFIVLFVNKSR